MGRAGAGSGGGGGHSSFSHSSSRSVSSHSVSHSSRAGSGSSYSSHSSYSSDGSYNHHRSPSYGSGGYYSHSNYGGYGGGGYYRQPTSFGAGQIDRYEPRGVRVVRTIIMIVLLLAVGYTLTSLKPWQPKVTHNKEKLTGVQSFYSDCITDELGWFDYPSSAGKKLQPFYDRTGVQPYVYLRSYDATLRTIQDKEAYARELFDELGLKENAFLFVYFAEANTDGEVGDMTVIKGKMVDSIMDEEATDIYWSYIDKYWYSDMSTDDLFAKAYDMTSSIIMTKSKTMADVLIILIGAAGIVGGGVVIILIMKTKRKHEAERAAETERILNTPMQDLAQGSQNDALVNKYK